MGVGGDRRQSSGSNELPARRREVGGPDLQYLEPLWVTFLMNYNCLIVNSGSEKRGSSLLSALSYP